MGFSFGAGSMGPGHGTHQFAGRSGQFAQLAEAVQLNRLQYYRGYTFFSAKTCVSELHELPTDERHLHLHEMSEVAHAVWRAFSPAVLRVSRVI